MIEFEPCIYSGTITVPPSKSISHRALICAAMCNGKKSIINNVSICDDVLSTADCLRKLGAEITFDGNKATVIGSSLIPTKKTTFNIKESGSTLRFIFPFAMLSEKECLFKMGKTLSERPLDVYEDIASEQCLTLLHDDCKITVEGPMQTGFFRIKGNISSQFISGLMLSLASTDGYSVIEITEKPVSLPYVFLTADVMKSFGYSVTINDNRIIIDGSVKPNGTEYTVEADWSSAAYIIGHNMLGSNIEIEGLNDDSLQGDRIIKTIFGKLKRSHPIVSIEDCPDLAPILMAVSPVFNGITLTDTSRLKYKESDRGEAMKTELNKFGISVDISDNEITVYHSDVTVPTIEIDSHNDHRIAMALSVLLSVIGGKLIGEECVSKSYPSYFDDLKSIMALYEED